MLLCGWLNFTVIEFSSVPFWGHSPERKEVGVLHHSSWTVLMQKHQYTVLLNNKIAISDTHTYQFIRFKHKSLWCADRNCILTSVSNINHWKSNTVWHIEAVTTNPTSALRRHLSSYWISSGLPHEGPVSGDGHHMYNLFSPWARCAYILPLPLCPWLVYMTRLHGRSQAWALGAQATSQTSLKSPSNETKPI